MPVEAVNINNKTYLPLRQLGDLVNVKINWNQDNNRIDITPSSQLIVRQIHEKKYVDATYWYDRYYTNLEAYFPYRFDFDSLTVF